MQKSCNQTFSSSHSYSRNSSSHTNNTYSATKFSDTYSTATSRDHIPPLPLIKKSKLNSLKSTKIEENHRKSSIFQEITHQQEIQVPRNNLMTLDEVATIRSFSPKSSVTFSEMPVQESVIVMKGCDLIDKQERNIFLGVE